MSSSFVSSAPGKVILSGEHSVVHGKLALAAVVGKRSFAEFQLSAESTGVVALHVLSPSGHKEFKWTLQDLKQLWQQHPEIAGKYTVSSSELRTQIDALMTGISLQLQSLSLGKVDEQTCSVFLFLLTVYCGSSSLTGLTVRVCTQLPLSSGLGSSAAYSVSLSQGFYHLQSSLSSSSSSFSPSSAPSSSSASASSSSSSSDALRFASDQLSLINSWSFEGERIMHGNPSGVDNTVATFGGALAFRRGLQPVVLEKVRGLRLLVVDTRQPRDTKKLVAGVGTRVQQYPAVMTPILNALHALALQVAGRVAPAQYAAVKALAESGGNVMTSSAATESKQDDELLNDEAIYQEMTTLFSMNHALLNSIGVGHPVLDRVVSLAAQHQLNGAKLTGAGGGGCALVLLPPPADTVADVDALVQQLAAAGGCLAFETTVGGAGALVHPNSTLEQLQAL